MKKVLSTLFIIISLFVASFSLGTTPVLAQIEPITNEAVPANLSDYNQARTGASAAFYLVFIWRALIFVGGLMVIIYFIIAAFEWISANGEASKISAARNKMTGAIAGFIVLSALFVMLEFIGNIFGLNLTNPIIPTPGGAPTVPASTGIPGTRS